MKQAIVFQRVFSTGMFLGLLLAMTSYVAANEKARESDLASPTVSNQKAESLPAAVVETVNWFRSQRNSVQGHSTSAYHLSEGVPTDLKQALAWSEKAARQNDSEAQYLTGMRLLLGQGVGRDVKRAGQWFYQSAKQGNRQAQYQLGNLFMQGLGLPRDLRRAAFWIEQSATQGLPQAQLRLGRWMVESEDQKQQGQQWIRKAAEENLPEAQWWLGSLLASDADQRVEAMIWAELADRSGEPRARHLTQQLRGELTPAELKEVEQGVVAFSSSSTTASR